MTTTPWIKLSATGLVAWFASGGSAGALPMLVVAGLLSLLALLDAAQGKVGEGARERIEERREKRAIGANDKALMMEASELLRRLLSRRVGPLYLALAGLAWLGFQVQPQDNASPRGSTGCLSCSASGLPTRITSPSGRITERTYDAERHLLTETIAAGAPAAATTQHKYDLAGHRISTTDPLDRTTTFEYDAANNRTRVIHPDKTKKSFAYNALGQVTAETNELGHTTKREYDAYNNLIATTTPEGHTTRTLFGSGDESSPKNKADDSSALHGYAVLHRPTTFISPSGITTAIHYDLLGRKLAVTKAPGTPEAATTTHQYDAVGNEIASLSPTGQKTTHTYDSRRRRITPRMPSSAPGHSPTTTALAPAAPPPAAEPTPPPTPVQPPRSTPTAHATKNSTTPSGS